MFGISGDKVSIILRDGTVINALIADTQADENGTEGANAYGHVHGGQYNLVEWETVGSVSSVLTNEPDLSGWRGKDIDRIINGGSIL